MNTERLKLTRRGFIRASVALSAPVGLAWVAGRALPGITETTFAQSLPLTPECLGADDVTPSQTEGPYFTRNSPERASLVEEGMAGTRLVVSGTVLSSGCQEVPGALLDFWQADNQGLYDNAGYRLRGHHFTDAEGRYNLETIVPGLYPGRTRHIHVKVQAPGGRVLTTQLYFRSEPGNQRDGIYRPELAMDLQADESGGRLAQFNFVVATA